MSSCENLFHMYVSGIVLSMSWTQTRTAECSHCLFMAIYVINSNAFPEVMQNSINYKIIIIAPVCDYINIKFDIIRIHPFIVIHQNFGGLWFNIKQYKLSLSYG